jgi:ATP synthase protein I
MAFHRPIPESKSRPKYARGLDALVEAEKLMQIALLLPSSAFIGWLLGAWLDKLLHQTWIGLVGVVFGGISGLVYVVKLAMRTARETPPDKSENEEKNEKNRPESKE